MPEQQFQLMVSTMFLTKCYCMVLCRCGGRGGLLSQQGLRINVLEAVLHFFSLTHLFIGCASAMEEHLRTLTNAVYDMVKIYLCSFSLAFPLDVNQEHVEKQREIRDASSITEHVHFMLFAIHGISASWVSR